MAANDVAAPLPQLDLLHGSVITVELDDPGAQITALNVHGFERNPEETGAPELVDTPWLVPLEA
jgi:hypothetical protein